MDSETENQDSAIKALGSLFKLTQVFLWDDASHSYNSKESTKLCGNGAPTASEYTPSLEDMELSQQMNTLGLPVSFRTSKKSTVGNRAKGKGHRMKAQSVHDNDKDRIIEVFKAKVEEVVSAIELHDNENVSLCCISPLSQCETSYSGNAEELSGSHFSSRDGGSIGIFTRKCTDAGQEEICEDVAGLVANCGKDHGIIPVSLMSNDVEELATHPINGDVEDSPGTAPEETLMSNKLVKYRGSAGSLDYDSEVDNLCADIATEQPLVPDLIVSSVQENHILNYEDGICKGYEDFGDWRPFWDDLYMRYYFYNMKTHESTWYPPAGLEHFAFSESKAQPRDMVVDAAERDVISRFCSNETKGQNLHDVQCKSYLFEDDSSADKLAGLSSHEISSGVDADAGSVSSSLVLPTVNCGDDHYDGVIDWSETEIKKSLNEEGSYVSLSDKLDNIDSLHTKWNQLGSEEVSRNGLQFTSMNSKLDKADVFDHFDGLNKAISLDDAHMVCDNSTAQTSDAGSVITRLANVVSEESTNAMHLEYMIGAAEELDLKPDSVTSKKKKKIRRMRSERKMLSDANQGLQVEGIPHDFSDDITKYWCQRYSLFSRFDNGIKMDEEGWFSVTPESIARHHAARCGGGVVIDCFTGVGGNAIQLAKRSNHVIAIDIDPQKVEYAQHNATLYGVDGSIDFINGDFFKLAPKLKAETVFLSPPWGGPDYAKVQIYDIETMLKPRDGYFLFNTSRGIASKIVMFLPRNVNLNQLARLSLSAHPPWALEVEKNFLNGKLKAITAYFSDTSV